MVELFVWSDKSFVDSRTKRNDLIVQNIMSLIDVTVLMEVSVIPVLEFQTFFKLVEEVG